jgi:pyruvate dehydrogenase E2 component (dihydrolipoamide acetyltransferase)
MAYKYHLPDLAEGMIEAEVVSWKVKVGDKIVMDQPVVEILTDKATMEIPSPAAGTLSEINYGEGEVCAVGAVLFVIAQDGDSSVAVERSGNGSKEPPRTSGFEIDDDAPTVNVRVPLDVVDASVGRARVLATPATRRIARKLGVELYRVPATGRRGRVTTSDVESFAQGGVVSSVPAVVARPQPPQRAPISLPTTGGEERIPFRGVRKIIADNMSRSMFTATHFTYVEEVDVTELVALRNQAKDKAAERGVHLTYLPFIIKAVVSGLRKWPQLNASLDEAAQEIVRKGYYHIGVAAQGPQGLMVTVVRDADQRSIFGVSQEVARLAEAVANGRATREELTGSTFTISSLGKLGGLHATPIINFPEVGILGVHKIEQRPVVLDGEIVARWRMNLSISLDHRIVDGWDGAMFVQDVKSMLEDPTIMFMEMV